MLFIAIPWLIYLLTSMWSLARVGTAKYKIYNSAIPIIVMSLSFNAAHCYTLVNIPFDLNVITGDKRGIKVKTVIVLYPTLCYHCHLILFNAIPWSIYLLTTIPIIVMSLSFNTVYCYTLINLPFDMSSFVIDSTANYKIRNSAIPIIVMSLSSNTVYCYTLINTPFDPNVIIGGREDR